MAETIIQQIRVEVTQEDIDGSRQMREDKGEKYRLCCECAVAVAVSRTLERPIRWAYTGGHYILENEPLPVKINLGVVDEDHDLLNTAINTFDNEQDDATRPKLAPFSFILEMYDYV